MDDPYGFYTHRVVKAGSQQEAEQKALEAMNKDDSFLLEGAECMPPEAEIYFEEIEELDRKPKNTKILGATWYKMSEADFDSD